MTSAWLEVDCHQMDVKWVAVSSLQIKGRLADWTVVGIGGYASQIGGNTVKWEVHEVRP